MLQSLHARTQFIDIDVLVQACIISQGYYGRYTWGRSLGSWAHTKPKEGFKLRTQLNWASIAVWSLGKLPVTRPHMLNCKQILGSWIGHSLASKPLQCVLLYTQGTCDVRYVVACTRTDDNEITLGWVAPGVWLDSFTNP